MIDDYKVEKITDYDIIENVKFPKYINVGFAVCSSECGNTEFINADKNHICGYCGKQMLIIKKRKYKLDAKSGNGKIKIRPHITKMVKQFKAYSQEEYLKIEKVDFPSNLDVWFSVCTKSCGNKSFIVDDQSQICSHCGKYLFRVEYLSYTVIE